MPEKMVVARSYKQAMEWARDRDITRRAWTYVDSPEKMRGCSGIELVFLPGWADHKSVAVIQDIRLEARLLEMRD